MGDNVTVDNGGLTDFVVSSDEAASGHVQRVKIAYSADGSDTHVTADSGGLLVNLGANNDVTITSGTVTIGGTPTVTFGGTASVNIVGGTAALSAGTAVVGKFYVANSTATADLLTLTSGTALAVGLYDGDGNQLTMAKPSVISSTPTLSTATYAAGDALSTNPLSFADAVQTSGGTGHILKLAIYDDDDEGVSLDVWFFRSSFTQTANSAFSLTDDQLDECVGVLRTSDGVWHDGINGKVMFLMPSPPLPYDVTATTLYAHVVTQGTPTYASTSDLEFRIHTLQD